MSDGKTYKRSPSGHAQRIQDEARAETLAAEATPVDALDGMAAGPAFNPDDIPARDRPVFERTEFERKTARLFMDRIGGPESADGKVGFAVMPRLADSQEDWELAASVTPEDTETQRWRDEARRVVMADVRALRELRRKDAREKLLATLKQ